jgi:hypothetical protein
MVGRKTQAQTIVDLIDRRLRSLLVKGLSNAERGVSPYAAKPMLESSQAFEDASFITRDDHRGGGQGDLPNSRPVFDLNCELVPDTDCSRRIGLSDRAWKIIYTHRLDLKSENRWLKLTVDYFYENIGFKTLSDSVRLNGFGNHRITDESGHAMFPNKTVVMIKRPLEYAEDISYTSIRSFRFDPWYSRWGINASTGIGCRKPCVSESSSQKPSVEAEIIDSGNPDYILIRFTNFLPYPVTVGVAVGF